ncbi:Uncharacterized protein FWK35_00003040 [Aphis craccivora]|uniref:Uncharacterized protein n=1 Tax=Aphis craccivora TaxID=307492 RepID=A0A6G0ZKF9_APHCR|nr:Uncharacterized protein FWK35_00003040 [Aphis craccivora]
MSRMLNNLMLVCGHVAINFQILFVDSERSDKCIDFTMIITSRNNAPISNFGAGFRCKSEYLWCIIEVKSKHFPTVFKKIEKNKKKRTEKWEFLRKTSFRPNLFFFMFKFLRSLWKIITRKFAILRNSYKSVDKILLALSKYLTI